MGNQNSKNEQDIKLFLSKKYKIQNYPNIVHRSTKKKAIVHQIITDSAQQSQSVRRDISLYNKLHCESINSVLEYIPLNSDKLCSQQQFHYVVEQDFQNYSLKQEFYARKYYKQKFNDVQILSVIKAFIGCLKIYHQQFHRRFHSITMECINIQQDKFCQIRMMDPLLSKEKMIFDDDMYGSRVDQSQKTKKRRLKKQQSQQFLPTKTGSIRQAPQKTQLKRKKFNLQKVQLEQMLSDLYTVGIIGAQMYRMQEFQSHQSKQTLLYQIKQITNQQLRTSIEILTSNNPKKRAQIYEHLAVNIRDYYALDKCHKNGRMNESNDPIWNKDLLNLPPMGVSAGYGQYNQSRPTDISFGQDGFINNNTDKYNNLSISPNNSQFLQNNSTFRPSEGITHSTYGNFATYNNQRDTNFANTYHGPPNSFSNQAIKSVFSGFSKPTQFNGKSNIPMLSTDRTFTSYNTTNTNNTQRAGLLTDRQNSSSQKPAISFNNTNNNFSSNLYTGSSTLNYSNKYSSDNTYKNTFTVPLVSGTLDKIAENKQSKIQLTALKDIEQKKSMYLQDYSPYKAQQNVSPLSQKDLSSSQTTPFTYQKIFDKYSHLNYETNAINKPITDPKIQSEMNKLLTKQPYQATPQSPHQILNNSPQVYLNSGSGTFANGFLNQGSGSLSANTIQQVKSGESSQSIPTYKPNKEVQEILKRLGIGSLLFGKQDDNKQEFKYESTQSHYLPSHSRSSASKNYEELSSNVLPPTRDKDQTQKSRQQKGQSSSINEIFQHRLNYNVIRRQGNSISPKNVSKKEDDLDPNISAQNQYQINQENTKPYKQTDHKNDQAGMDDRETTPIRPTNKGKYNSTIVEVGDENSSNSDHSNSKQRKEQEQLNLKRQYVVQQYQTGSRYEGYKIENKRDGQGKFFYQDGGYYQGQWRNNKMDGWGKLYYQGGKLAYEGNWSQDQFHGFGKVYNDNPQPLDCGFDFTNFDLLEDYWLFYEGMLVKDTKEGRGKIKLTNSELFEGDFHSDRIQGFGKFFMNDGTMVEGIWRDSKLIKIINS